MWTKTGMIAAMEFPAGSEICLHWSHSVTGGPVADCFEHHDGRLVLMRSYLHDFAAGLGEVPGRGRIEAAPEGGYWITDIAEIMPDNALAIRIGPERVGHVLEGQGQTLALSQLAPDQRAHLRLTTPAPSNE